MTQPSPPPKYMMAKIEMPILMYSDGHYDVFNEYSRISFSDIDKLPEKSAHPQIYLSDLFSEPNHQTPSFTKINWTKEVEPFHKDPSATSSSQIVIKNTPDTIPIQQIDHELSDASDASDTPIVLLKSEIPSKPRKRNEHGKTFKHQPNHTQQYTRKNYGDGDGDGDDDDDDDDV